MRVVLRSLKVSIFEARRLIFHRCSYRSEWVETEVPLLSILPLYCFGLVVSGLRCDFAGEMEEINGDEG